MKLRLRNFDNEPFQLELDWPEARDGYPLLWIQRYAQFMLSFSVQPGPFVELMLAEDNVTLTRDSGGLGTRQQQETLISTPVTRGAGSPVAAPAQKSGKPGLMGRLFGGAKPAGTLVRVRTADAPEYVFETTLIPGRYKRNVFEGPELSVYQQRSGLLQMESRIAGLCVRPDGVFDICLINGTVSRVDSKDSERTVMSTERAA